MVDRHRVKLRAVGNGMTETESSESAPHSDNSKRVRPGTSPLSLCAASVHWVL